MAAMTAAHGYPPHSCPSAGNWWFEKGRCSQAGPLRGPGFRPFRGTNSRQKAYPSKASRRRLPARHRRKKRYFVAFCQSRMLVHELLVERHAHCAAIGLLAENQIERIDQTSRYPNVAPAVRLAATLPGSTYAMAATKAGPSRATVRRVMPGV